MSKADFRDYTHSVYSLKNSGTANSYINAINILDRVLAETNKADLFGLEGKSLCDIEDEELAKRLVDYIREEEGKMRKGEDSIFNNINPNQTSYPRKRFCSAAVAHLLRYVQEKIKEQEADEIVARSSSGKEVGKQLNEFFDVNKKGTDVEVHSTARRGQHYFRNMILNIYDNKCCLTGLDIPQVLRASHICAWAQDKENRMNPQNGLCLSATYDAAFDKNLISLDEDYRLILSSDIKDYYTSEAFNEYFRKLEGTRITMPKSFIPDQRFLSKHRSLMA